MEKIDEETQEQKKKRTKNIAEKEEVEETVTHLDIMAERITKVKEEYESAIDGINKSAESKKKKDSQ